jgi:hypothetical protein
MILGMSVAAFTLFHVILSLIGIAGGIIVMFGMWAAKRMPAMTALFLVTTILTSVTGFFFHSAAFGPPHIVGVISLVVLAVTLLALYVYHLAGRWRWIYVVTAVFALYLNVFVGVVQAFQKIPFLNQFAPQGNEPPFAIAQAIVLLLFVASGWLAVKRFHPTGEPAVVAPRMAPPAAKLG